jgi:hypothetical protein
MTCHAVPVWLEVHGHQEQGQDNVVRGTQKGPNFGTRCRSNPRGKNGIRNQDVKKQLCLGKERTFCRISRKTVELEGSAPSGTKKITAHGVRFMDVGALTTLETFACTNQRKMMVINLDVLALRTRGHKEGAAGAIGE